MCKKDPRYLMLQEIRKRPGLFLGKVSLEALDHFLFGYDMREWAYRYKNQTGKEFFENFDEANKTPLDNDELDCSNPDDFNNFVHSHYNHKMSTLNEFSLLSRKCNSDEEAFFKYFELLDQFLETD